MLTRADVERIINNVIQEKTTLFKEDLIKNLSIVVKDGGFTDPNSRKIGIYYDEELITEAWFDVVQTDEYDG